MQRIRLSGRFIQMLCFVILVFCALPAMAGQFSADMIQGEGPNKVLAGKIYVKDHMYRMDMKDDGQHISVIVDQGEGMTRVLVPAEKMFMEVENKDPKSMSNNPFQSFKYMTSHYQSKSLGTETVNGYSCEKVHISDQGQDLLTAWVSTKLDFPIKIVYHMTKGMFVEIRNIKEDPVGEAVFVVPEGFAKSDRMPVEAPAWAKDVPSAPMMEAPLKKILKANEIIRIKPKSGFHLKVSGENRAEEKAAFTSVAFKGGRPIKEPSFTTFNLSRKNQGMNFTHKERPGEADEIVVRVREGHILISAELIEAPEKKSTVTVDKSKGQAGSAKGNIVFILDASGSMWAKVEGKAKIEIAKEVMADLIKALPDKTNAGLVAYGHRLKSDCNDVEDLVSLGPLSKDLFMGKIQAISPKGKTPITLSVRKTAEKLKGIEGETTIILVSDGKETCEGDPCELVKELKAAGIKFIMHVIGFDVTAEEKKQLECVAKAGGGAYYNAENAGQLLAGLNEIIKTVLVKNLLVRGFDKARQPLDVFVRVYKAGTEERVSSGGGKEASFNLPADSYDLVVQDTITRAEQKIANVTVKKDKLTERDVVFTMGRIGVSAVGQDGKPTEIYLTIYRTDSGEAIRVFQSGVKEGRHVVIVSPGVYKMEVTDLKGKQKKDLNNIKINDGQEVIREVSFAQGKLGVKVMNMAGQPISAYVTMYRIEGKRTQAVSQGGVKDGLRLANVTPGVFNIVVSSDKTRERKTIEGIKVDGGQEVIKEFSFGQGRLGISVKDEAGNEVKNLYITFDRTDTSPPIRVSQGGNKVIHVAPGVYSIEVVAVKLKKRMTLKDIRIEDGQEIIEEIVFK